MVYGLWDYFLLQNSTFFFYYFLIAFLMGKREKLLSTDTSILPQRVSGLKFEEIGELRELLKR